MRLDCWARHIRHDILQLHHNSVCINLLNYALAMNVRDLGLPPNDGPYALVDVARAAMAKYSTFANMHKKLLKVHGRRQPF